VDELLSLFLDRRDDSRMGMAYGETDESGVEVDELVTIDVLDDAPVSAFCGEWIESDEGLGDYGFVLLDEGACFGAWRSDDYPGILVSRQVDRRVASRVYY